MLKMMPRFVGALIGALLLFSGAASAQSNPGWGYGFVPTPGQWNAEWSSKQDWLGSAPCLINGCTMTGLLITAPSIAGAAGFNVPAGVAPSAPNNGDIWTTAAGIFVQIAGATVGPLVSSSGPDVFTGQITTQGLTTTQPGWFAQITGDTVARTRIGPNSVDVPAISFGPGNAARDTHLERAAPATWRFGSADAAAPIAQTLVVQNVVAGTSNIAGANLTIDGSQGTGTGAGGSIIFQVAPAGSTGTAQNALSPALTLNSAKLATFGGHVSIEGVTSTGATGTGSLVFGTSPALVTPALGTPTSITLTSGTGLPISTGLTGVGTGGLTALAVNVGTAGSFVVNGGALGTPSSGNGSNLTSLTYSALPSLSANQVLGALTATTPSGQSVPSCSTASSALQWTSGTGFGCNSSITATTNANLTGDVTSVGNATTLTNAPVIAKVLTGFASGAGTVSAADSILTAFNKVVGNDALKLPIASPVFTTSITGPLHAGGTAAGSNLVLESTSGAGTTDFIAFQTASQVERMRILTGGSVGIGTSTPQSIFHVNLNTVQNTPNLIPGVQISLADATAGGLQIDSFGANPQITMRGAGGTAASKTATTSGSFLFILDAEGYSGSVYSGQALMGAQAAETWGSTNRGAFMSVQTTPVGSTSRAEAMRIQASGGLSVGVSTDPGIGSLQINANVFAPNLPTTTGALGAAVCWTAATGQFQRDTNAGGCLVSSERYKHDIKPISDGLSMVMASNPVTYVYNNNIGIKGEQVGFIAEQMATVSEDLIGRLDDGTINSVRYMQYTAVLARAVQQLKAENDDLSQRLKKLEIR